MFWRRFAFIVLVSLTASACFGGGGGGDSDSSDDDNTPSSQISSSDEDSKFGEVKFGLAKFQ